MSTERPPSRDCELVREAVSAQLDDEGLAMRADRLAAHLDGCPSCQAFAERSAALRRHLAVRSPRRPPADLADTLHPLLTPVAMPLTVAARRQAWLAGRSGARLAPRCWAPLSAAALAVVISLRLALPLHAHIDPHRHVTPCTVALYRQGPFR